MKRTFTTQEAQNIGEQIGIDFREVSLEQFRKGLSVELEHGNQDPLTNVTNDNLPMTAKIVWAHINEIPDYYDRLEKMESDTKKLEEA